MVEGAAVDDRVRGSDDARSCKERRLPRPASVALLPSSVSSEFSFCYTSHACRATAVTRDLRVLSFAHSCL
jgi:hypothetical protein